jgi:hypothetical protein
VSGKLTGNVVLRDPKTRGVVTLLEGQPLPDWADDQVGDHLVTGRGSKPPKGPTIAELQAEIDKRNEGREDDNKIVPEAPGNKPELIAALEADDLSATE